MDAGTAIVNVGTADSDESDPDTDTETVEVVQDPGITLEKSADLNSVQEGGVGNQQVTYTYIVTNTGNVTLTNVLLTDTDDSPTLVSGDLDDDGDLDVGEVWTFSLVVTVPTKNAGATHTNTAEVTTDEGPSDDDEVTIDYTDVLPTINVVKTPSGNPVPINTNVTYTYHVTNTSPAGAYDPLDGITISDTDGTPTYQSGDDGDGLLEVGETWVYTLSVLMTEFGAHINTVTACGTDDENNQACDTDTVTINVVSDVTSDGRTIGYWRNKNGQSELAANDKATAFSEIQKVKLSGGLSTDTFKLSLDGLNFTAPLAKGASASTVQAALAALPGVGTGNVTVTKSGSTFTVKFVKALANTNMPQMTAMTVSGAVVAAVSTTQEGGLLANNWRSVLNSLNLRKADGSLFLISETATFSTAYSAFKSWLGAAGATNMAYMLSAQLAAMALNVLTGKIASTAVLYIGPGSPLNVQASFDAGAAQFDPLTDGQVQTVGGSITVQNVMNNAKNMLEFYGDTTASGPARNYEDTLKRVLDAGNNGLL
jgi:uncharacterized repeat protein (TIGR01451 family)